MRGAGRAGASALVAALALLVLVLPLAGSAVAATTVPVVDTTFSVLLNTFRTTHGLGPLTVDAELSNVARAWSGQMAAVGTISHNPALLSQVQGWTDIGENVASGGLADRIFAALLGSPVHLANMSNPRFTRVGIGTVVDARGTLWTTHVFIRPSSAGATPPPQVTPASTTTPSTARAPRPTAPPVITNAPRAASPPSAAAPPPTTTTISAQVSAAGSGPTATTIPTQVSAAGSGPTASPAPLALAAASSHQDGAPTGQMAGAGLLLVVLSLLTGAVAVRRHPA